MRDNEGGSGANDAPAAVQRYDDPVPAHHHNYTMSVCHCNGPVPTHHQNGMTLEEEEEE